MKIAMKHLLKVRVQKPQNNDCKKKREGKEGKIEYEKSKKEKL